MSAAATGPAAKPSPLMRPQPGNPGRRIGVYGMGEIGRKIASRLAAFETEVGYFSRSRHDVPYQFFRAWKRWRNGAAC
jgi:hydroxypyruvate reductase